MINKHRDECKTLELEWKTSPRWNGVRRVYTAQDVVNLRGSLVVDHTLGRLGALRLWDFFQKKEYVTALGATTGNQAVQQVRAGLPVIYVSGWQVAADQNEAQQMYPDQSLYPSNSVPHLVKRINNALLRADQIMVSEGKKDTYWFAPIVADAEAGFGGPLNAFELTKAMIEAGAAGVHFEDQLSSAKKCGHLGGKVLASSAEFIQKLVAARLAADILGVPTMIIARTDAKTAKYLASDVDRTDRPFIAVDRTTEGYYRISGGLDMAISRSLLYAPYADILWYETDLPDLADAEKFAEAIHREYPTKILAYNCSPSFNWTKLDRTFAKTFHSELANLGYRFQFVTLAGFHSLNSHMFKLSKDFLEGGMEAYARFQAEEFNQEHLGYQALRHQSFVGTGYYEKIMEVVSKRTASLVTLEDSTETLQF